MKQSPQILTYGVTEQNAVADRADAHAEEILCKGYTILPDVFTPEETATSRRLTDELYEAQKKAFGGSEKLARARDENIVRCPLAYDNHFLSVATHACVQEVVARLLGKTYILLMQNCIINREEKEQYNVRWHRDLNYQHWTSSRPVALSFLCAADKFYADGGATWALPGSHRFEKFPSDAYVAKHEVCLEASAGSVIMMDAMTYHRAGINKTPGYVRRGINHVIGMPFMAQQIDIPMMLAAQGKDFSKDAFLAAYLGYRWNPAPDVETWRQKHTN